MHKTEKPLRIAMFGQKRVPSREGGVEIVCEELSTRLVEQGHEVTLYNRRGHHVSGHEFDTAELREYKGVRMRYMPVIDKKGLAALSSSFFAAIATAFSKYDIVHVHAEGPCAMLWLPKLLGKRCIVTIHGLDHQRTKWSRFARSYILLGEKVAVRFADEIIVLSSNVQQYFEKTYGRKTCFIANGVSKPECAEADEIKKKYGLEKDGYILFLGRIVPEKRILLLIESFKRVVTDKKLVIAGGASDTQGFMDELRALASDDPRIIFTGFVQGRTLCELYDNAYVYTLPSDLEGMPLSLLEAMSYGNCCLVSDIPECADVVREHGVKFRKGDGTDLTNKLQLLVNQPEAVQAYKDTAADYILREFSWDVMAEKTVALYEGKAEKK